MKTHKQWNMSVVDMKNGKNHKIKVRAGHHNKRNLSLNNMKRLQKMSVNINAKKLELMDNKSLIKGNQRGLYNVMRTKAYSDAAILNEGPSNPSSKNINVNF